MKLILYVLAALALVGVAVAQAVDPTAEPKTWGETIQFLIQIVGPLVAAIAIGFKNPKELLTRKTTYAGFSVIAGSIVAFTSHTIDAPTAMYAVAFGLGIIFLRDGQISVEKILQEVRNEKSEQEASKARATKRG